MSDSQVLDQYRRKISKDEINALPIVRYEGEIKLITEEEALHDALQELKAERVLGFDTETKPSFRKGSINAPSLIQMAAEHTVYLIQLQWVPFNEAMAEVLGAPHIVKAGVSIIDDMRELQKLHSFEPAGLADLGNMARAHKLETQGLRNLAANFFNFRISKGPQCSNWSAQVLSERQIVYAATDAWVGRQVYLRMEELGMA